MTGLLKEMISDYMDNGSRVDWVLCQEIEKVIKQAERVQELKKECKSLKELEYLSEMKSKELEKQNKRYCEAFESIIKLAPMSPHGYRTIARQALESESNE